MAKVPDKPDRSDNLSGHQPILQLLALTRHLQRLGLGDAGKGLDLLRTQLLLLLWRYPDASLEQVRVRFYLDATAMTHAIVGLRRKGYLKATISKASMRQRTPILRQRWQLTARARKIAPTLLRAEEKFNRTLAGHGAMFSAHWCYDLQNINSALQRAIDSPVKKNQEK